MKEYLSGAILLLFCTFSASGIRMQRDFSYPAVNEFNVYWNVPTAMCRRHGFKFDDETVKYGIISNPNDEFRGSRVVILYDPGMFPAMMKNRQGRRQERNGGIPQLGNLTVHMEAFKNVVNEVVPRDFNGVGIIDFEIWKPILRQNWNDQTIYKNMSKELERQRHPQWKEDRISATASYHFEEASREFMGATLQLAKFLRPRAVWGYYAFPYCYNYRKENNAKCMEIAEKENDRMQWMWDESTALYPSIYLSSKLNEEHQKRFVIGNLNEAWRMATRTAKGRPTLVLPYLWFKYYDSDKFVTKADMYNTLDITQKYKMGGAVIWGSSDNVNTKEGCSALMKYLKEVLGPAVAKAKKNAERSQEAEPNPGFVPLSPLSLAAKVPSTIANAINPTFHSSDNTDHTVPRRETTTLSPALENYLAWYRLLRTFV